MGISIVPQTANNVRTLDHQSQQSGQSPAHCMPMSTAGSLDITRQLTENATYMRTETPLLNGHPVQDMWWWGGGATNPKPAYSRICHASTSSKLISITPSSCAGRLKGGPPPQGDADQGHYTWLAEEAPSPCGVR